MASQRFQELRLFSVSNCRTGVPILQSVGSYKDFVTKTSRGFAMAAAWLWQWLHYASIAKISKKLRLFSSI